MKSLLILLWFGIMTMGIQAQNEERSKKKEGRVPAQSQTNKTHKIKEVKVQPQFSIGYFMLNEIEYPKESLDLLDEGQVVVQFKVQSNGEIRDIEVLNSVSEKLDEQVISCLKRTNGKWTPDEENGKPVESIRKMLVTFDIKNNSPLNQRSINHYTKGIKHIYRAELYEKDDALSENKRINKLNRQYKRALYHFTEAGKFQAEESTIYYWQYYANKKLGDVEKMEENLQAYKSTIK